MSEWKWEKHRRRRLEEGEERTLERREKSARAADFTGIDRETETETRDPFCEAIGASKIKYLLAPAPSARALLPE